MPDAALDRLVTELRADRDFVNGFARVRSYKATEDDIGEDFERAENYLSLVGLVIVILGGIGVSSVTRVFVQQKIRSIAILKCVGGRSQSAADDLHGAGRRARAWPAALSAWCSPASRSTRFPPTLAAAATPGIDVNYR